MSPPDPPRWRSFADLPRAHGGAAIRGRLRERPEDFLVDEVLGFEPDGEGEHALLHVRKTGVNTEWVARQLASHAGLPAAAVGYGGLKDRHAVATQWFSLHTGQQGGADWRALRVEGVEILAVDRHRKKLRRGALRGNRFRLRIRGLSGERDGLAERIERVRRLGVPHYFGAQRFGNGEGNLHGAHALFTGQAKRVGRHLRGLWLSAARSQIFNEVLALRVERGDWNRPLSGDRIQLAGSRSHFLAETIDEALRERTRTFDVHPSGPLWGSGELLTRGDAALLEQRVADSFAPWGEGLVSAGLRQERRPLRLEVADIEAGVSADDVLEIGFYLTAGAYATAVVRELVDWSSAA
ncbi:MAG: tRNA pseudouridine(13) synthase TruD [Pseudomonadota bacterium]|nr:tRNA pseudouridine(13) synthase TruD [Pseudomonadota bacterium]